MGASVGGAQTRPSVARSSGSVACPAAGCTRHEPRGGVLWFGLASGARRRASGLMVT